MTYPDSVSGSDVVSYTYNRLGQQTTVTDQRGTVRTFLYDTLGRLTDDCVTTVGVDTQSSPRRISTAYEVRGMVQSISSHDNATPGSGTVLNQVAMTYNAFGQLTEEQQDHGGAVSGSSPSVQYGYDSGASGSNEIRPATLTYPNGRVITYSHGSSGGMSDYLNRVDAIEDTTSGTTTLASYTYLGAGTVVRITYPEPSVWLDLWGGTSGFFSGIDRFGRIIDQRWQNSVTSTPVDIDRYQYGYDRNGNRTWKANVVGTSAAAPGFDELYAYDALNRLTRMQRGVLSGDKSSIGRSLGVSQLGRWVVSGNSEVHVVKLADAVTGIDLPGASVSVDTSGATAGQYLYGSLSGMAVLMPSHGYYLMSQEANAGDQWYDQDTTLTAAGDLTIDHAAWYDTSYHQVGGSGASYVPPNFIYGVSQPAATGQTLGTARNNFPGWVGFRFTTTLGVAARQMDWTLDPTGNWSNFTTQTAGTTDLDQSRTANPVNEITGITESTGPTWIVPAYDAAGNMTTMPQVADPTTSFTAVYDAWNRMVSISASGTTVAK